MQSLEWSCLWANSIKHAMTMPQVCWSFLPQSTCKILFTVLEAIENLTLALCKHQKWKEQVKVTCSKCQKFGDFVMNSTCTCIRDRRATLRLGRGTISDSILGGGGGGQKTLFLAPLAPPTSRSVAMTLARILKTKNTPKFHESVWEFAWDWSWEDIACPPNAKFRSFSVKFSVFLNFTSATVFNIKFPNFQHLLTFTCSCHFWHCTYRVLLSGFQLPQEPWKGSIRNYYMYMYMYV